MKKYRLTDGSYVTAKEVANKIGCSDALARSRLSRYIDPKNVFMPKNTKSNKASEPKKKKLKYYLLNNGESVTAIDVADKANISITQARKRLNKHKDPDIVFLKQEAKTEDNSLKMRNIKTRMFYDPQGHWKLLNANT